MVALPVGPMEIDISGSSDEDEFVEAESGNLIDDPKASFSYQQHEGEFSDEENHEDEFTRELEESDFDTYVNQTNRFIRRRSTLPVDEQVVLELQRHQSLTDRLQIASGVEPVDNSDLGSSPV